MSCVFCDICAGKIRGELVELEDRDICAFRDINPKAPVHILIAPRKHIVSVMDFSADDLVLAGKILFAANEIARREGLAGFKLAFNVGRTGGQVVDHVHMHLLGGWEKPEDWKKGFVGAL